MHYCPECGSEITSEDIFCGNCGIALTPLVPVGEDIKNAPISEDEANDNETNKSAESPVELTEEVMSAPITPPISEPSKREISTRSEEKHSEDFSASAHLSSKVEPIYDLNRPLENKTDFNKQTSENFPMRTESVDLPPRAAEKETNAKSGEDLISFSDDLNPAILSEHVSERNSDQPDEADFQATMPYAPNDFGAPKINEPKKEEKPLEKFQPAKLSSADSEKFAVGENAAPISAPNVPVGSSPHDSLEPKLISVQIYDPKQQPEETEPPTLLNSTEDVKAIVEQAKVEQSEVVQSKEKRSYTSPNIGGSETDGKSKAKLKPLDEGTILNNRYEIVRKIGGGGMGAVYLASDKNLGGISRAVKEMVQSYIEDEQQEKAVNDFRRESMLLTSLEHPSIPTIYDYFFDEKEARFYLVMKYIAGGDLAARLRSASEGKIDEQSVTEWGIQLADVLDYLHNRQPPIVYRDLKPSNIMIDGNTGRVMLIDFGIARWVNKEEKGVTAVGTMGYAPPELFSGNVEPRSDIYSLGSTMFHLLTGADPQSNPLLIFDFHKNPRPRQINPQLSDQIEQILMKMVEYSAGKRFASAAELRDALAKHLENLKKGSVTMGASESRTAAAPAANQPVFCGFCGQKIFAADVFCPFCGAQQAASGGNVAAVQPKAAARLMIIGTNELDSPIFKLEKDNNLVGRRDPMSNIFPEVDLSKFDPQTKISRRHARIWRENDSYMVEDLGSSNGTILIRQTNESQKLSRNQPRNLVNGDKIRVGDTTLYFVFD